MSEPISVIVNEPDFITIDCRCGCDLSLLLQRSVYGYNDINKIMGPNDMISICSDKKINRKLNTFPKGHGDFSIPDDKRFDYYDYFTVYNRKSREILYKDQQLWNIKPVETDCQ